MLQQVVLLIIKERTGRQQPVNMAPNIIIELKDSLNTVALRKLLVKILLEERLEQLLLLTLHRKQQAHPEIQLRPITLRLRMLRVEGQQRALQLRTTHRKPLVLVTQLQQLLLQTLILARLQRITQARADQLIQVVLLQLWFTKDLQRQVLRQK